MHLDPEFLAPTTVIDADHPDIIALAQALTGTYPPETVRTIFEYVRDRITHPADTGGTAVAVSASETLQSGEGVCHAQAALLAALYRAAGIPAALRYQQVESETGQSVLHGIATVWAPDISETGGFLLVDPRYPESDARHSGHDWQTRSLQPPFERNLPMIHTDMLPVVVNALRGASDAQSLLRDGLPGTLN
ncbi:transglutaminase domain-containing protein [Corynebacterium sp.]|uniref:transglutaminase domain-containing protein n=1 Tax=Corynebacterium sp. TaxID=1720 RepID=UPI0019B7BDD2|nr:transglutaminase domain-containing protein [Corynebacterium sp.]HHU67329.1 transglutaminase family protein [Corynebacterium sp.]